MSKGDKYTVVVEIGGVEKLYDVVAKANGSKVSLYFPRNQNEEWVEVQVLDKNGNVSSIQRFHRSTIRAILQGREGAPATKRTAK